MKNIFLFLGLILILFLIIACTPPDEPTLFDKEKNNQLPISNQISEIVENTPVPNIIEESQVYPDEITELIERSTNLESYHYFFSSSKMNQFESYQAGESYQAYVKGNKIKKIYSEPVKLDSDTHYNEVYLDSKKETALVTCNSRTVLCDGNRLKAYSLDYAAVKINLNPLEIIKKLPKDVKKIGTEAIDNRQAAVLEYVNADGNKEKLYLDTYSGFPLKQESFIQDDDEDILFQKNNFDLKGINNVKNSDMILPDNHVIVE